MYIDVFGDEESKIYTIEELQEMVPTIEDIRNFQESSSLYLSLVVNMFKFCGYSDSDEEILNICRTQPDFYRKYTWTKEQRSEYEHIMSDIFKKCLGLKNRFEAYHEISLWNMMGTAFNLENYSDEYYNDYLKLVSDLSPVTKCHTINVSKD